MLETTTIPCTLECIAKGTPFEMGFAQGKTLREKIGLSMGVLERLEAFRLAQPGWLPYSIFRRLSEMRATQFLKDPLQRNFPEALQRMNGIAAGAEVTLRHLFLLHAMEPMLSDVRNKAVASPALGACSAVAIRGKRSTTSEPIIARNFDYLPLVQPMCAVRESRPVSRFRSLDFTIAPFAGAFDGVNERGLCITFDYAYVRDFSNSGTAPISIVIAETLERCSTVDEAVAWIRSRPRWGGALLMLADDGGDIASMELSNTRTEVRRPGTGEDAIFHSNAFFTEGMRSVQVDSNMRYAGNAPAPLRGRRLHESAEVRDRRFQQLMKDNEPMNMEQLHAVMADHENVDIPGGNSICTHSNYWNTTASVQLFPKQRRMRISFSSACTADYSELAL